MYKYCLSILILLFSFTALAMSSEYEKREIDRCVSATGGNPTETAVCAGKRLTRTQINKCIKGDCFGNNDEMRNAFVSLYGLQLRKKQSCGNFLIGPIKDGSAEFTTDKSWQLCSGYKVIFQKDGNLVVFNKNGKPVWSSGTHGMGADRLKLQSNGDLVIYKQSYPIWSAGTHGNPGAILAVQEDGNLAIYNRYEKPVWATGTNGK